jgi:hypothetical protein
MVKSWQVEVLHLTQKTERVSFWNGLSYGISKYDVEVTYGMASLLNVMKIYQMVQELLLGMVL